MKKLLGLIILMITLFLSGCEMYMEPTTPSLNINSNWRLINVIVSHSEWVEIINDNYYAQSPYKLISTSGDMMLVQNDITNIQPCFFYKLGYVWEFQNNLLTLEDDKGTVLREYYVNFGNIYYNPNDFELVDKITGQNIPGNWHLSFSANGAMPASDLFITVPDLWFYFTGSERSRDGMVKQQITLQFTR